MIDISKTVHVMLTDRDYKMLFELYENVVTSFYQIQKMFFNGRSHATAMNRLRLLEDSGLIKRTKVPRIKAWAGGREVGVVFQVTAKSIRCLEQKFNEWEFVEKIPIINPHALDHDLLINDIKEAVLGLCEGGMWLNGRYLNDLNGYKKIPDAVIKIPNSVQVIAIEVELHAKSSSRYRQILNEFRASPKISQVIYITAGLQIDRKILSELEGYAVPLGFKSKSEVFKFMSVAEMTQGKQSPHLDVGVCV